LFELLNAGLIVELTSDEKGEISRFMPAEDISRMTVGLMIDRLESYGRWKIDLDVSGLFVGEWGRVIEVRSAYLREARTILLKDL
jgi:membrane protein